MTVVWIVFQMRVCLSLLRIVPISVILICQVFCLSEAHTITHYRTHHTIFFKLKFAFVFWHCSYLLHWWGCDNITYKTIRHLVKFSKQLSELDLSECVGIDDTAFCYVTHMPSINIVNFAECNSILWNTDKLQEENL